MNKIERAINYINKLPLPEAVFVAKGENLGDNSRTLVESIFPNADLAARQKILSGDIQIILDKGAMKSLATQPTEDIWGIVPLDKIAEWAINQAGYASFRELRQDFRLIALGGGECKVELALDPKRKDLLNALRTNGLLGLANLMKTNNERILTDTPGIARFMFKQERDNDLIDEKPGSIEAFMKWYSVIINIVQTGDSLREEGWLRPSQAPYQLSQAVLLSSQLMLVINKEVLKEKYGYTNI